MASAFLGAGILLFRDLASSRRERVLPDMVSLTAWSSAALLELHAYSPVVSASRVVPAALFPAVAFLLAAPTAAACAIVALTWMAWTSVAGFAESGTVAQIAAMAAVGFAGGRIARRWCPDVGGRFLRRDPLREARPGAPYGVQPKADDSGEPFVPADLPGERAPWDRELDEGIRRVIEGLFPVAGADRIVYVSTSANPRKRFAAHVVAPLATAADLRGREFPDGYLPLQEAILFQRTFFAEGAAAAPWGFAAAAGECRPAGVAAVPVAGDGAPEGALLAYRLDGAGGWTEPVVPLLEMGAFFIGREVAGARRRYRNERLLGRRRAVARLARTIAEAAEKGAAEEGESASPRREVYGTAVEQIRVQLDVARVLLVEADETGMRGRVVCRATGDGASAETCTEPSWTALGGTYAEWVLRNKVHRIFSAVRTSPGRHPVLPGQWTRDDEDAYMLVPLEGGGGFRGILVCISRGDRNFHKRDAETVREILAIMRMGISHARHIELLEERATKDGLTGLLNHKTFRERLSSVLSRFDRRYGCAVIMVDIDHFKSVNDTYGHPAGDEVLKNVAKIIQKTIRRIDMAARYGGEEFVLYLHHADAAQAVRAAERLRLIIAQTRFEFAGREAQVTASLGVACYPSDGGDAGELLEQADKALYRSKQGGRNRTTICGEVALKE